MTSYVKVKIRRPMEEMAIKKSTSNHYQENIQLRGRQGYEYSCRAELIIFDRMIINSKYNINRKKI